MDVKVFVSQPMNGMNIERVKEVRTEALKKFKEFAVANKWMSEADRVLDINLLFDEKAPSDSDGRIWYLGRSIQTIDVADYIIFVDGWMDAHGCRVEHKVAEEYFGYNIEMMSRCFSPCNVYTDGTLMSTSPLSPIDEIWFGRYQKTNVDT